MIHSDVTEAAWYALAPFINPIDCSRAVEFETESGETYSCPIPLNRNANLEAFYNGELIDGARYRPSWFTKRRLAAHLLGSDTYYYRSKPNGFWRLGYGSSDRSIEKLGTVAETLNIEGRCRKYPWVGTMLLCADIDAHNGERDVEAVRDWLLSDVFPGCYWEPSTGGQGVHLYVKLAYRPWQLGKQDRTLRHVIETVNRVASLLEDRRVELKFDAPLDKLRGLPSVFAADGDRVKIHRSLCIKIPRFSGGISAVRQFHLAPWTLFDGLERLVSDSDNPSEAQDANGSSVVSEALGWEIDSNSSPPHGKDSGGGMSLNSVYPSYTEEIELLKAQQDAFTRTQHFALVYSRHIRRVPSVDEAVAEYEAQGLATGSDTTGRRRTRMEYVLQHVRKTFQSKRDWHENFEAKRVEMEAEIEPRLTPAIDLSYAKGKDRRAMASVGDLASLLFSMRQSQGCGTSTEFSQAQVIRTVTRLTGRSCSRNKAACLTRALCTMNFIRKSKNYIVGKRGNVFEVASAGCVFS